MSKFSKPNDAGGLSRDDVSGDIGGIPGAYPVFSPTFDNTHPPAGLEFGYGPAAYEPGPSEPVQYQQGIYHSQSPYHPPRTHRIQAMERCQQRRQQRRCGTRSISEIHRFMISHRNKAAINTKAVMNLTQYRILTLLNMD